MEISFEDLLILAKTKRADINEADLEKSIFLPRKIMPAKFVKQGRVILFTLFPPPTSSLVGALIKPVLRPPFFMIFRRWQASPPKNSRKILVKKLLG